MQIILYAYMHSYIANRCNGSTEVNSNATLSLQTQAVSFTIEDENVSMHK